MPEQYRQSSEQILSHFCFASPQERPENRFRHGRRQLHARESFHVALPTVQIAIDCLANHRQLQALLQHIFGKTILAGSSGPCLVHLQSFDSHVPTEIRRCYEADDATAPAAVLLQATEALVERPDVTFDFGCGWWHAVYNQRHRDDDTRPFVFSQLARQ